MKRKPMTYSIYLCFGWYNESPQEVLDYYKLENLSLKEAKEKIKQIKKFVEERKVEIIEYTIINWGNLEEAYIVKERFW